MPLTQKAIDELKEIYEKEYKESLSDKEAWEMGTRLINFLAIILRPLPDKKNISHGSNNRKSGT